MKHLMIGVSLAILAIATPAHAGRYLVEQCSPNQNKEKWFLIFDKQGNIVNFSKAGSDKPRYGSYVTSDGASYMNVTNDTAASMDLKLRPNHDPAGKPVLEWTSGTEQSTMLCDFLYESDNTPVNWVFPPGPQPDAPQQAYTPPAVETNSAPGYTCTGSDGVVRACDTQQVIPPSTTAYAPEATTSSSGLVVPLTSYGIGGHTVNVTLGISTPATMLIDTGATVVSLPKDVADQLIGIGDAVVITQANFTIADGTTSTQNVIDIGRFTIGGRTLYHIKAGVGPVGSMMLLGTNVLDRFGKYSIDSANNQLILG
jgi:clan AA aspartic protease (TIGR02281 family)